MTILQTMTASKPLKINDLSPGKGGPPGENDFHIPQEAREPRPVERKQPGWQPLLPNRHYIVAPLFHVESVTANSARVLFLIASLAGGRHTYELELLKDGRSRDITFDPDGNVLEVEEQIDFASLPKPVAAAIQKEVGTDHLGKIESLNREGTLISYETTVARNGKRREIAFRPDGFAMKPD
jgi:hypothetical protein